MDLNTILITQARTGSTRFPRKILKEIQGKTLLEIHLNRLKKCKNISEIIVATTLKEEDEIVYNKALSWGFSSFRGSEKDVLDRFYQSIKYKKCDWIVRVTSDCPLIDPELVDTLVDLAIKNDKDYCTNTLVENFPDGQDIEVFKRSALVFSWKNATLNSEREHVTPYIRNNSDFNKSNLFSAINYPCVQDYSNIRMTVDEPEDLDIIKTLINNLGHNKTWLEYTKFILDNKLYKLNEHIIRNEGYKKSLTND